MKPTLSDLAAAMFGIIPPGDLRNYVSDLSAWHTLDPKKNAVIREFIPEKPANAPYYGEAFANALTALRLGHTGRIAYHLDRLKAAVKRNGKDGVLQEAKRVDLAIGNIPQPTDRKDFQTAYVPRAGKE